MTKDRLPRAAGVVLGLLFVFVGLNFFLGLVPMGRSGAEHQAAFVGAMATTGYLAFVKTLQIVGGVLVAVPKTRNVGLLVLTPIVLNIAAVHVFLGDGSGLAQPLTMAAIALTIFLLWSARAKLPALLSSIAIDVDPELEAQITEQVSTGGWSSVTDYLRARLQDAAELDSLRLAIAEGDAQLDRGEHVDGAQVEAELDAEIDALEKSQKG